MIIKQSAAVSEVPTSPGKAAYFRPLDQVKGYMLPTLKKDVGKGSAWLYNPIAVAISLDLFSSRNATHLVSCFSFPSLRSSTEKTGRERYLPKGGRNIYIYIYKAVLRVCALYAASCSGISPGGLKWFPCVQCLLGEEGRVSTSVDTRL